jgi:hypothetical protein
MPPVRKFQFNDPIKKSLTRFLSPAVGLRIACTVGVSPCRDRPPIRQYRMPHDAVSPDGWSVYPSEMSSAISCSRHLPVPKAIVPCRRGCSECRSAPCGTKSANTRLMASTFRHRTEPEKGPASSPLTARSDGLDAGHFSQLSAVLDRQISNTATARIGEPVPSRHFIGRPMKVNWPAPSRASRLHRLSMCVMSSSKHAL